MKTFPSRTAFVLCFAALALPASAQVVATPDHIGDALQYLVPLGAAGMAAYHHDLEGAKQLGVTLLVSQGTTEALKHIIDSPRPDGTGYGFPSGHTSAVFAAAGFVNFRYGAVESIPFYALATVTAYERVHTHHHFTKDVIGGAAVGVGSAYFFTHPLANGDVVGMSPRAGGLWLSYASRW